MANKCVKAYNDEGFVPTGVAWSVYIPEGSTYKVFMTVDNGEHYAEFAEDSDLTGPTIFQCMGYNMGSGFKIQGIQDEEGVDILL